MSRAPLLDNEKIRKIFTQVGLGSLTKEQRDWALKAVAAALAFILLLIVYGSAQSEALSVSRRLRERQREIQKSRITGVNELGAQELARLQKRSAAFKEGFANFSEIASILDEISIEAEKNHVAVLSLVSDPTAPVAGRDGGEGPKIEGSPIRLLPIQLRVQASFQNLTVFLYSLRYSRHRLAIIESYSISRPTPESRDLNCKLVLHFYVKGA